MDPNPSQTQTELARGQQPNVVAFFGGRRHSERNQHPSPKSDSIQERWHVLILLLFAVILGIVLFTHALGVR